MKKIIAAALVFASLLLFASCAASEPRGIRTIEINEKGELIVIFTDGTTSNAGVVKGEKGDAGENGADGKDGQNGENGADGKDGKNGAQGSQGLKGTEGRDGRSISGVTVDNSGNLVVKYSDGKTERVELLGSLYLFGGFLNEEKTATWSIYNGGILYIGGTGETADYEIGKAPWSSVTALISAVCIDLTGELVLDDDLLCDLSPEIIKYATRLPDTYARWVDMAVEAPIFGSEEEVLAPATSTPVAKLPLGTEMAVVEENETFAVIIYDGEYAYIEKKYVRDNNGSVVFEMPEGYTRIKVVNSGGGSLRLFPDATAQTNVYATVPKGTVLNITGVSMNKTWYRVSYEGKSLYIYYTVIETLSE